MANRSVPRAKFDKQYEALTAEILRTFNPHAQIILDAKIRGKSGRIRQVDVAVRSTIAGQSIFLAFECKHYGRPVALKQVDELIGKIEDVRAQIGILVSDSGFDAGAIARAREHGRIQLCQLVDSTQSWLKTNLSVALVVSYIVFEWPYQISFHRIKAATGNASRIRPIDTSVAEDRAFLEDHLKRAGKLTVEDFHRWLSEEASELSDGKYQRVVHVGYPNEDSVQWSFAFRRSTETFSKDDILLAAMGLFDTMQGKVSVGNVGGFTLEETVIRSSWNPQTPKYNRGGVNHYSRLSLPSIDSARDIIDNLLHQLQQWGIAHWSSGRP